MNCFIRMLSSYIKYEVVFNATDSLPEYWLHLQVLAYHWNLSEGYGGIKDINEFMVENIIENFPVFDYEENYNSVSQLIQVKYFKYTLN